MPLLKRIAELYEEPSNDLFRREFNGWQNALFYAMPIVSLYSFFPIQDRVHRYGDQAKRLGLLFVHGSSTTDSPSEAGGTTPTADNNRPLRLALAGVLERDARICIVMSTAGPTEYTRIVPRAVINLEKRALDSILRLTGRFVDKNFRSYVRTTIEILQSLGDRPWNFLTLGNDICELFRRGMVGFKPSHVAAERDKNGRVTTYQAAFSFHWLGRNCIEGDDMATPDDHSFDEMLSPWEGFPDARVDGLTCNINACRAHDGRLIYLACDGRDQAQMMLSMLALRWIAGSVWYLAGASGLAPGEVTGSDGSSRYDSGGSG
ncbi:hypothetical protein ISF_09199 [Cordyceps fumosorosea ARSEF 2679]|uniref:Uncharacterized protein n=1 Tax=Cordyceps fumosorosea (strain ARSEF 2679) TaxID=1081104 RepID=A0A167LCE2_CORFA|nr:hypothetical protein ISF_09199 [Cordyceps fumosorosea ARSEF 2679]OAA52921.1 hypothetical protein ISF_09199 [Cordyceps fumosorosea ARSEF 2679]